MFFLKDLIKNIRNSVNMNQEQFAECLGTTVLSINRWENGKTEKKHIQAILYKHEVSETVMIVAE